MGMIEAKGGQWTGKGPAKLTEMCRGWSWLQADLSGDAVIRPFINDRGL